MKFHVGLYSLISTTMHFSCKPKNDTDVNMHGPYAMSIVGYNDDLWIDENNNGAVDAGELGGLKAANSWGERYDRTIDNVDQITGKPVETVLRTNDGFLWISYSALKKEATWEDKAYRAYWGGTIHKSSMYYWS